MSDAIPGLGAAHRACQHPACQATIRLLDHGAGLWWGWGRQCELAVVAAAPPPGLTPDEVVEQRRRYAAHLGVDLRDRTLNGDMADSDAPDHVRNAVNNYVGAPGANRNAVNTGAVRFTFLNGRFSVQWPP